MLECLEHVWFVYNKSHSLSHFDLCSVFSPVFSVRAHTRIWGRGGENQADYKASLIWLRHRGSFLSLSLSPILSLPLSPSFSSDGDRKGDWGAEALIGSITAQMSWPYTSKSHPLSRIRPPSPCINTLTSYSRRSYCFGLAKGKWSDLAELLYLSAEHLRGANDCLRYHSLCNGSLNDSLESADKDICYFTSGQTASSSSSSVLVPCVSEFKVTSLMSCYDISPP